MCASTVRSVFRFAIAFSYAAFCTAHFSAAQSTNDLMLAEKVDQLVSRYCSGCHSESEPEGDLVLLSSADLLRSRPDQPALVVATKPADSRLIHLLLGSEKPKMPPADEPQLNAEDLEAVTDWIAKGARASKPVSPLTARMPINLENGHASYVTSADLLVADRYVLGRYGQLQFRQLATTDVETVGGFAGKVAALRRSNDSKTLIVGSGLVGVLGEISILDTTTHQVLRRWQGHQDLINCIAISPDNRLVATGSYDRKIHLWDLQSGELLRTLTGHNGAIYDLDFHPTQPMLASASGDQTVKLWSTTDGSRLDTLGQPEGEMHCVRFIHEGRELVAAGSDRQIRKWRVDPQATAGSPMLAASFAHEREVLQLSVLGDKHLVTAAADGSVKLWNADALWPIGEITRTQSLPVALLATDTGAIMIADLKGEVKAVSVEQIEKLIASQPVQPSSEVGDSTIMPANSNSDDTTLTPLEELEPNNSVAAAQKITLPVELRGSIEATESASSTAQDLFQFSAKANELWMIEVFAAAEKSPLDSLIDILDDSGRPVLQTRLQALRESYFTFRGKDSSTSDDFRLHDWEEMELDDYLYSNGEVTRLWLYPRGPDSGFKVYPGTGARHTFFGTTAISHALGETAYVVRPLGIDEAAQPNGLPVFPVYFENDDDPNRERGADSRLAFAAPVTGTYYLRIRDARGFGGTDFRYRVVVRAPKPDYQLSFSKLELNIHRGSGQEFSVTAKRMDNLNAPIAIHLRNLPAGVIATNPIIIGAGQQSALGTVFIEPDAEFDAAEFEIELDAATLQPNGEPSHEKKLEQKIRCTVAEPSGLQIRLADSNSQTIDELSLQAGDTVAAKLLIARNSITGAISFGKDDSGRNLPHGAIVDNIGLNGLLIVDGQDEREVFITASPILKPGRYQFHFRSESKDNPTSKPIWLNVTR